MRRATCVVLCAGGAGAGAGAGAGLAGAQETAVVPTDLAALMTPSPTVVAAPPCPTIPAIFDFTDACATHDACYPSGQTQLACDDAFRQDMVSECAADFPSALDLRRHLCPVVANDTTSSRSSYRSRCKQNRRRPAA